MFFHVDIMKTRDIVNMTDYERISKHETEQLNAVRRKDIDRYYQKVTVAFPFP